MTGLSNSENRCPGCMAVFTQLQSQSCNHPYIGASADCWAMYTAVLAKEYQDPSFFKIHRIIVDAYCAQHIGDQADRRSRQSAWIHLIALYLYYEKPQYLTHLVESYPNPTKTSNAFLGFLGIISRSGVIRSEVNLSIAITKAFSPYLNNEQASRW